MVYCCAKIKQQSTVPKHKLTCNMRSIEFSHADRQSLYSYLFISIFTCGSRYFMCCSEHSMQIGLTKNDINVKISMIKF